MKFKHRNKSVVGATYLMCPGTFAGSHSHCRGSKEYWARHRSTWWSDLQKYESSTSDEQHFWHNKIRFWLSEILFLHNVQKIYSLYNQSHQTTSVGTIFFVTQRRAKAAQGRWVRQWQGKLSRWWGCHRRASGWGLLIIRPIVVCVRAKDVFGGREGRRLLRSWTREQLHKANQEECRVGFRS